MDRFLVIALIAGAVAFLCLRWWRGRRKSCGGGCGCVIATGKPEPTCRKRPGDAGGGSGVGGDGVEGDGGGCGGDGGGD